MKRIFTLSIAVFALAAAVQAQSVKIDFDPSADFAGVRSYSFQSGKKIGGSALLDNTLIDSRIRQAVERELGARNVRETRDNPDVLVAYHVGRKDRVDVDAFSYGIGPRWRAGWTDVMVTNYTEGTLILDIIDAQTNELIWRAYCTGAVTSPEQAGKKIDKAAKKAFKKYPPQS